MNQTDHLKQQFLANEILFVPACTQVQALTNDYLESFKTMMAWVAIKERQETVTRRLELLNRDYPEGLCRGDEIFLLFEGMCPYCYGDAKIVEISGSHEFLQDHEMDSVPAHEWSETPEQAEIGDITLRCENGHEHFVTKHWTGDWS